MSPRSCCVAIRSRRVLPGADAGARGRRRSGPGGSRLPRLRDDAAARARCRTVGDHHRAVRRADLRRAAGGRRSAVAEPARRPAIRRPRRGVGGPDGVLEGRGARRRASCRRRRRGRHREVPVGRRTADMVARTAAPSWPTPAPTRRKESSGTARSPRGCAPRAWPPACAASTAPGRPSSPASCPSCWRPLWRCRSRSPRASNDAVCSTPSPSSCSSPARRRCWSSTTPSGAIGRRCNSSTTCCGSRQAAGCSSSPPCAGRSSGTSTPSTPSSAAPMPSNGAPRSSSTAWTPTRRRSWRRGSPRTASVAPISTGSTARPRGTRCSSWRPCGPVGMPALPIVR